MTLTSDDFIQWREYAAEPDRSTVSDLHSRTWHLWVLTRKELDSASKAAYVVIHSPLVGIPNPALISLLK